MTHAVTLWPISGMQFVHVTFSIQLTWNYWYQVLLETTKKDLVPGSTT